MKLANHLTSKKFSCGPKKLSVIYVANEIVLHKISHYTMKTQNLSVYLHGLIQSLQDHDFSQKEIFLVVFCTFQNNHSTFWSLLVTFGHFERAIV